MSRKSIMVVLLTVILNLSISFQTMADDEATFISVAPDALILLDLSGSMVWNPAGGTNKYGHDASCVPNTTACGNDPDPLENGYKSSSLGGCSVDCSRVQIAKRALFAVLDNDGNGIIDSHDSDSLNVRIGYMRFYNASSETDSGISLRVISSDGATTMGTPYQTTFCGSSTSCTANEAACNTSNMSTGHTMSSSESIATACASGGTPLAEALRQAKAELDRHKSKDEFAKTCRQKFVILITDGADTYTCGGDGSECQAHMYKRRRAVVAATKQLADAGYKVFVIGVGATMPSYLLNTLNWMAFYGGTVTDPLITPPATPAYNIPNDCDPTALPVPTGACCINMTSATYAAACFPSGITSCVADSAPLTANCISGSSSIPTTNFRGASNDPGWVNLTGYAFIAADATAMNAALKNVIQQIGASSYSFTQASIQTVRTVDENFLYEATFVPLRAPNADSFWPGSLKRYTITGDVIAASTTWDAGAQLKLQADSARHIYTYKSGAITEFTAGNITTTDLALTGATAAAMKAMTMTFIRGGEQAGAYQNWKLGDIFHSTPVTIGTPSEYFYDRIDQSATKAFDTFRSTYPRTTANGRRLIIAGANDGQFHVFRAAELTSGGGQEMWSFIPPNFLPRLPVISHLSHPVVASCTHQYFVDGPTAAYEVWLGSDKTAKVSTDWHTLLVIAEGDGGVSNLWSSSASCDSGFSDNYSASTNHYCGYYAFDITDTTWTTPSFKWMLGGTAGLSAAYGSYLGQPWSKMVIDRVDVSGDEKWVGFIGGGYSATSGAAGKGFYVVNAGDGTIRWSYTYGTDAAMAYALPGMAATIDYNNDGFVDRAYIGDMGGNIWRFKFCLSDASCTWSGGKFFNSTAGQPIFSKPLLTIDNLGQLWVYFGTGNVLDPNGRTTYDAIYAVKDLNSASTYNIGNLADLSSGAVYDPNSTTYSGWYIKLPQGEKILADPSMYEGVLYFTTYTPPAASSPTVSRDCLAGTGKAYALDYITGYGLWGSGARWVSLGYGVPGSVQGSINPSTGGVTLFVTSSEGVTEHVHNYGTSLTDVMDKPDVPGSSKANWLYWRDRRIQP